MGDQVLTAENLITGSLADDDVAIGGYHIGIHRPSGSGWRWDCGRSTTGGGLHGLAPGVGGPVGYSAE
ncbi:hypothetical protein [Actinoallomurus sp. NBC_01490]|uniref:hypothetical protein n=1 Tax=Actinoallomurus sp. NBC_01490 TaxID=2903557 RepID=UPI003FA40784